ncbi:MAG: hypothetical protein JXK92_06890 [Erysipelotrichaceae bacterium]|nr:hypothetical protein [Erysipelotrichaceae bacterium]
MLKFARLFLFLILIVGCAQSTDPLVDFDKPVPIADPVGKTVSSPVVFEAVYENPITFEPLHEFLYPSSNWIAVRGLKDETIQANINQEIKDAYDRLITYSKLETLPPYRGLKTKIDEGYIGYPTVSTAVTYNKNNVLSIVLNGQYQFTRNDGSDSIYVGAVEALTFDLTSGRSLKIGDLFTNDKPAKDILNPLVFELIRIKSSEYIDSSSYPFVGGYGYLEEVSPFQGIQGNQVFSLDTTGVTLYFDYRTPRFDTRNMPFTFTIPFGLIESNFAGTLRFQLETYPYLNPVSSYSYLSTYSREKRVTLQENTVLDGYPFYRYLSYPQDTQPWALDRIHAVDASASADIRTLFDGKISYAYRSIVFNTLGPYSILDVYTSIQGEDRYAYLQQHETYDAEQNQIAFDDLFKEGYDIDTLLRKKINEQLSYFDEEWGMKDRVDEYLANLSFRIDVAGITVDSYAESPFNKNLYSISVYLGYDEIGCENLKMFEEYFK